MTKTSSHICWVENSIRPYESQWSILNKFFALNVVTSGTFAKEFFTHGHFNAIETSVLGDPISFDYHKFYSALGLKAKDYKLCSLSYLKKGLVGIEKNSLKYCPICIEFYYHSIFFQLEWLKTCPIHDIPLISKCLSCDATLSTRITPSIIRNPYCCAKCETKIFETCREGILKTPNLVGFEKFQEIDEWCNHTLTLLNEHEVISRTRKGVPNNWFYPLYKNISHRPIPDIFEVKSAYIDSVTHQYKCGLKPDNKKDNGPDLLTGLLNGSKNIQNLAPIFKSYRKYLIKKEVGNWGKVKLKQDYGGWIGQLDLSEKYIKLFSLLIYTDTLCRWGGNVQTPYAKRFLYMGFNFYDVYEALTLCKNSQEAEWVISHAYFEELRGLFQETLIAAEEMIRKKSLWVYWPLRSVHLPCSFISRQKQTNQLIFSAVQTAGFIGMLPTSNPYEYVEQQQLLA